MFRPISHRSAQRSTIDLDFLTVELRVIEQADRQNRVFGVSHFDKPETAADARFVTNGERSAHLSGAPKQSHQIDTRDRSSEIANVNFGHARLSSPSSKPVNISPSEGN
jgi:hypothetical protein